MKTVKKRDFTDILALRKPSAAVILVGRATLVLLGVAKGEKAEWDAIKTEFKKQNFIENLASFIESEKNRLPVARMKKLAALSKTNGFTPE